MSQGPFPGVKVGGNAVPRPAISAIIMAFSGLRGPKDSFLHCVLAICGAVYCNRSCLWVCLFVGVCVCVLDLLPR